VNTANVPHQHEIDAASAAMLRMPDDEVELLKATAWMIAKDSGMDDWRLALYEAWTASRHTQEA
jgi:hypothetical protein